MRKFLLLFSILFVGCLAGQEKQVHIKYLNVRSVIANVYEDLYTNGKKVISKQDGNIIWTNPHYNKDKKSQDIYYISNINTSDTERDFFFNSFVKDNAEDYYFVHDKVPHIEWKVEKETSKKILGFECTKATAVFRGSPITAYFTEEIPFSVGPFKFFGLPGAILDVRVDGKNYDLWKAVKVEIDNTTAVDYNPQFSNFTKANMKDYTNLRDEAINKHIDAGKVEGSTGKRVSGRMGVEKVFEWENE